MNEPLLIIHHQQHCLTIGGAETHRLATLTLDLPQQIPHKSADCVHVVQPNWRSARSHQSRTVLGTRLLSHLRAQSICRCDTTLPRLGLVGGAPLQCSKVVGAIGFSNMSAGSPPTQGLRRTRHHPRSDTCPPTLFCSKYSGTRACAHA